MTKNEQALCEAMVRLLEREASLTRSNVSYPERDGSGPPVEMRFSLGERRFAIEQLLR